MPTRRPVSRGPPSSPCGVRDRNSDRVSTLSCRSSSLGFMNVKHIVMSEADQARDETAPRSLAHASAVVSSPQCEASAIRFANAQARTVLAFETQEAAKEGSMSHPLRPWHLTKALELIEQDPARAWTVGELARTCRVGRRALENHFR